MTSGNNKETGCGLVMKRKLERGKNKGEEGREKAGKERNR